MTRVPCLAVTVHDPFNGVLVTRNVVRSPALVGRGYVNAIRLCTGTVSRYHGAFLFGPGALQYVDLGSSNGTRVDGSPVASDIPIDIRNNTVIEIGSFRLTVDLRLIAGSELADLTEVSAYSESSSRESAGVLTLMRGGRGAAPGSPSRGDKVAALLAELLAKFRPEGVLQGAPFSAENPNPDEVLGYLTDPDAPGRIEQLRASLTTIFERSGRAPRVS